MIYCVNLSLQLKNEHGATAPEDKTGFCGLPLCIYGMPTSKTAEKGTIL